MKRATFVIMAAVVMASILVFVGYTKAAEEKPVKIGVITWRTGVAAHSGNYCIQGVDLAVKEINARGGILGGRRVEFKVYDEGFTPEVSVASTRRAIADGVAGIVGFSDATTAIPAVQVAKDAGIPLMVIFAGSDRIVEEGYHGLVHVTARLGPRIDSEIAWFEKQGYKSFIHVAFDSEFTHLLDKRFHEVWDRPGSPVKIYPSIFFPYGQAESTVELTKAVGLNPDFIHNDVWGLELILSSKKRLRELGYKGGYATCQSTMTPEVIETDPKLMEGAYSVSQWVPDPTVPANLEFTRKIEEMTGRPSHLYQEGFYEGAMILLLGMDKAGTDSDLKRIADAMHSLDWMTPRGEKLKIEPDGHVAFEFWTMGQVRNGKLFAADRLFFEK